MKKFKSIIKKKSKKADKLELNTIEVSIFKALMESSNLHKFVSKNNILRKCNEMKEETKNPATSVDYTV